MNAPHPRIVDLLGLPASTSAAALMDLVEAGLPLSAVDRVAQVYAPNEPAFRNAILSATAYAGLEAAGRPVPAMVGARVVRLATAWLRALDAWVLEADARAFLARRHPLLGGRAPVEIVMQSEFGPATVEDLLRRLDFSSAA